MTELLGELLELRIKAREEYHGLLEDNSTDAARTRQRLLSLQADLLCKELRFLADVGFFHEPQTEILDAEPDNTFRIADDVWQQCSKEVAALEVALIAAQTGHPKELLRLDDGLSCPVSSEF